MGSGTVKCAVRLQLPDMLAFLGVACAFMGRAKSALCPVHVLLLLSLVCLQELLPGGSLVAMVGRGCGVPGSAWGWLGPSTGLIVTESQVKSKVCSSSQRSSSWSLLEDVLLEKMVCC